MILLRGKSIRGEPPSAIAMSTVTSAPSFTKERKERKKERKKERECKVGNHRREAAGQITREKKNL
jgi:hypothetical protein